VVGFLATLITMSGFGDHHPGLRDHDDRNAQLRERLHPEFDVAFVSSPDKSRSDIPSHEQVRGAWNVVNAELWKGFETMSWSDWVQRYSAISEEEFAKDASRNRFAVLLSRTNHLSYHLGQAVLGLK
jgi:hypothetical protein